MNEKTFRTVIVGVDLSIDLRIENYEREKNEKSVYQHLKTEKTEYA